MKPVRSAETVKLRRELAQLLRRLRAIRRARLPHDEMAAQMSSALKEAKSFTQLMAFSEITAADAEDVDGSVRRMIGTPHVDRRALRAAERGE